ncbi:MAG: hypothetical protein K5656_01220 [Lachnospiraceae bacterium]|nr:hypothetical protein [Lachnospiraceae bacterium]
MAKGRKQKLKIFYLYKIMCEETDQTNYFTKPRIADQPASYVVDSMQDSSHIPEKELITIIQKLTSLVEIYNTDLPERDVSVPGRVKRMNESVCDRTDAVLSCVAS